MMDHHGPAVRLSTMILRLVAHLILAALLVCTVESSSSSSSLLLIPADSSRPAQISSRPSSPDEAADNGLDTSEDECKSVSFSISPVRLFQPFVTNSVAVQDEQISWVTGRIVESWKRHSQEMRPFSIPLACDWMDRSFCWKTIPFWWKGSNSSAFLRLSVESVHLLLLSNSLGVDKKMMSFETAWHVKVIVSRHS